MNDNTEKFMAYKINGEFGEVRHVHVPIGLPKQPVPFQIMNAGWHRCNENYQIHREHGFPTGHLLLFSVSEGGKTMFNSKESISLPESSVVWIPPKCKHSYFTEPGKIWEFYWLHIADSDWLHLEQIFSEHSWIPISNMQTICSEFESMLSKQKRSLEESHIEFSSRISSIYHLLLQESFSQNIKKQKCDSLVQNIIKCMEADYQSEWSLAQLSKQYYLSVPQLIRRFKAETGVTPYSYLMTIRLHAAEIYLKYTMLTIEEISYKIGFSSTSNFIVQFQKHYGTTPQQYRNIFL